MVEKPDLKAIFDAPSDAGSADSCDPDWCHDILEKADPKDAARIKQAFLERRTESEVASSLGIWPSHEVRWRVNKNDSYSDWVRQVS